MPPVQDQSKNEKFLIVEKDYLLGSYTLKSDDNFGSLKIEDEIEWLRFTDRKVLRTDTDEPFKFKDGREIYHTERVD